MEVVGGGAGRALVLPRPEALGPALRTISQPALGAVWWLGLGCSTLWAAFGSAFTVLT